MTVVTIADIGPSKGELADLAFEECGLAGFEFQRTPEEITSAIRQLDTMMYEHPWNLLGFVHADGLPDELSGIPLSAKSVVAQYLALRIAPKLGATLSAESRAAMSRSLMLLQSELATIPMAPLMSTPAGAGNRRRVSFIRDE